jgi:tRNA A-37 threonylcarbamoyl transferase component Bud32
MDDFRHFCAGDIRWQVRHDLPVGQLFDTGGLRLAEWISSGLAHIVKQGPHRTVFHVQLPGLDFHLKHYPLANTRAWLRQLVRPSKARSEHDRTLAVAARGVPTLESLAVGEGPGPAQASFLITRTLTGSVPLSDYLEGTFPGLPAAEQARMRQSLAAALGAFVARLHQAGVTHDDLHPANLLLRAGEPLPRLYLIDLHAVRLGRPLDWTQSRANLVVFNRWFILRALRADRRRFWEAYEQERRALGAQASVKHLIFTTPTAHAVRQLERETLASNLEFWRHHDPRCVHDNRYFRRLRSAGVTGHAVRDLDLAFIQALLADPDAPFRHADVILLKNSRTSTVAELTLPGSQGPRQVIYKRFNVTSWIDPLTGLLRPTPAQRSYRMGHALRWRGLPTPRPLLVMHRRRAGLPAEGYLLTEKLPQVQNVLDYVNDLASRPVADRRRCLLAMLEQLAKLVRTMHQRKVTHRDLKAANVLLSSQPWQVTHPDRGPDVPTSKRQEASAMAQLWLIDLVGVRLAAKLRRRLRVKNLMRLAASFLAHPLVTRTDKLRFLNTYLGCGLRGRAGWKWWWRQIDRATQTKVLRNRRKGRAFV